MSKYCCSFFFQINSVGFRGYLYACGMHHFVKTNTISMKMNMMEKKSANKQNINRSVRVAITIGIFPFFLSPFLFLSVFLLCAPAAHAGKQHFIKFAANTRTIRQLNNPHQNTGRRRQGSALLRPHKRYGC